MHQIFSIQKVRLLICLSIIFFGLAGGISNVEATVSQPISNPVTFIEGDINQNGTVDIFDFNTLVTDFGKTGIGLAADFNQNGRIDIFDFNTLVTNFGKHL